MFIADKDQWKREQGSVMSPAVWDRRLSAQLGRDLRVQYEEAMKGPLPNCLVMLLVRLEERERMENPEPPS